MVPAYRLLGILILLFLAGCAGSPPVIVATQAPGPALTFTPVADAFVYQSSPNTNYGSDTSLRVDNSPMMRSYLRFSVSGLAGKQVVRAILKLYANSSLSAGFSVNAVTDDTWTETKITYNNAPAVGAALKKSGFVTSGSRISIDISPYITGDGTYNLALTALSNTQLNLASREAGSKAPQLVITYTSLPPSFTPTGTPTQTATATGTPLPQVTSTETSSPIRTPTGTPSPNLTPTETTSPTITSTASVPLTITPTPTSGTGQIPVFSHVIIVIFENTEYSSVIGNSALTNFNNLAAQYTLLTQSYAVSHPSLPNYIALTSGSTQGITDDCTSCFLDVTNLADSIETAGRTWKAYMEDMPSPCFSGSSGTYAQKHNPFVYYDDIRTNPTRCQQHVVPLTQLDTDLQQKILPDFAWVTPNLCNDAHDCPLTTADAFLGSLASKILSSPAFDQNSLLVVTFDEGTSDKGCCGLPASAGGHIATILISPLVKNGFQDGTPYSHYSLLKTVGQAWGLPLLGNSADAANSLILAPWK